MKEVAGNIASREQMGRVGRKLTASAVMVVVLVSALFFGACVAEAKTFTVNAAMDAVDANPGDGICATAPPAVCTLRAAIQEANSYPGDDTIILNKGVYILTITGRGEDSAATGDLDIVSNITIKGKGSKKTFINGNKIDRVFHVIGSGVVLTVSDLTIQNGLALDSSMAAYGDGGGIFNYGGGVNLTKVAVSNNSVSSASLTACRGGGIAMLGGAAKLALKNSAVSRNTVQGTSYSYGGGIYSEGGTVNMSTSTITGNLVSCPATLGQAYGGGVADSAFGYWTITNSSITENTASGGYTRGGGADFTVATVIITGGSISDNTSIGSTMAMGGGIALYGGTADAAHCTIARNSVSGSFSYGGGIYCYEPSLSAMFSQCTISQNSALGTTSPGLGGAFHINDGMVTISGGSITENSAMGTAGQGGGLYTNVATLYIQDGAKVTGNIASDYGGGVYTTGPVPTVTVVLSGNIPNDKNF